MPFLLFALCFLFSALSLSSFFMRSSMLVWLEAPDLESSSTIIVLPSSSNLGGGS
jgi:hypothetical protein